MSWQSTVLYAGEASGSVLRLDAPLSFWGGVDPISAKVTLAGHPQVGETITGKVLVIPELVGSSSSSAIMLELLHTDRAPSALILANVDAILPVGVVVAAQMQWPTIPVVSLPEPPFQTGDHLKISTSGLITAVTSRS